MLRPACSRGRLPALSIESFGDIVTSIAAPIATGWSESCQVGIAPTEDRHLDTAHTDTIILWLLAQMGKPILQFFFVLDSQQTLRNVLGLAADKIDENAVSVVLILLHGFPLVKRLNVVRLFENTVIVDDRDEISKPASVSRVP
jgi:hypothetical protein